MPVNNSKIEKKIVAMKKAAEIAIQLLEELEKMISPGVETIKLDKFAHEFIVSKQAKPSFLKYQGYPCSICTSIDDVIVHGIPRKDLVLEEGQVVSVDIGVCKDGYHVDCARTFPVGKISKDKEKLVRVTRECFFEATKNLKDGSRIGDIGASVQRHAEKNGFSVIRNLIGHGVGKNLHEKPDIPNYGTFGTGSKIKKGDTLAIEPMVTISAAFARFGANWDCRTTDGKPCSHHENTILVTENGVEILTEKTGV